MPPPDDQGDRVLTMELVERFGGDVSALALREGELTAARHETEVRLAGRDVAATSLAAVALVRRFCLQTGPPCERSPRRCRDGALHS